MKFKFTYWFVVAVAIGIYITMLAWSLPTLMQFADGLLAFDLRPTGYSFAEARIYLGKLGEEGAAFYQNVQHRLDAFFPVFEGVAIGWSIWLLTPAGLQKWQILLASLAIPGTIFDYLENAAVGQMLRAEGEKLTVEMVEIASRWTVLKSIFVTISLTVLLVLIVIWFFRRFKHGSD